MEQNIIIANGEFPTKKQTLELINNANKIICCDGALTNILKIGKVPDVIIGDLDSISAKDKEKYNDRIIHNPDQNTNDLSKAVNYCKENNINNITILGATGKREDHTLGNIALLLDYSKYLNVKIISDFGTFIPCNSSTSLDTFNGQQISIFSFTKDLEITSTCLKYPLNKTKLSKLWSGTLNQATDNKISLDFSNGEIIVYLGFGD